MIDRNPIQTMSRKLLFICLLLVIPALLKAQTYDSHYHKQHSLLFTDPPDQYNDFFAAAGACMFCHNAQLDEAGNSVAIVNDWRSTMMANAARDPFWKAKVSHETLVYPQLKTEIETVCTRCHAPMGNINAFKTGAESYTITEMNEDSIALDGVSCTVCHQIIPESMGNSSGNFLTSDNKMIYGPYPDPFGNPMINNTGYQPVYSEHIKDSRLCASCHTLITNPLDFDGVPTGGEFVEQAPYQEWENSIFPAQGTDCYSCHVPEIDDIVKLSTMPPWLEGRTPYGKHHFAGANAFMLKLLRANIEELGLTAETVQFDSTIARTIKNLQLKTLSLQLAEISRDKDTLVIEIELENMAGHKLPSAYPSRRVFIELFAISNNSDTIFHSGKMDVDNNIIGEDVGFEPHYDLIHSPEQVQIYEMVMGDVNGEITTVLERSSMHLKDNRIPPAGFTTDHFSYDTVKIVGNALSDANFNKTNGTQGSGRDAVYYNILVNGTQWDIEVTAKVHYQTVSNKWLQEMFAYSSADIDAFKSFYDEADKTPVLMASSSLTSGYVSSPEHESKQFLVFPNPSNGNIRIINPKDLKSIQVYSLNGMLIKSISIHNDSDPIEMDISDKKGIYILVAETGNDKSFQKIIIN